MLKTKQDTHIMRKPTKELRAVKQLLACLTGQKKAPPAWLSEEHYLLCGMSRSVIDALSSSSVLPYTKDLKGRMVPYAFVVSETVLPNADTEEMISALGHFELDEGFLRAFPTLRAAVVLCEISAHRYDRVPPKEFGAWIDQLRYTKKIDWSAVHDALSRTEGFLMQDPSGAYPLCDDETKAAYRGALYRYAKRYGMTEEDAAQKLLSAAENADTEEETDIAYHLFPRVRDVRGVTIHIIGYLSAILLAVIAAAVIGSGIGQSIIIACMLFLPFYALVRSCMTEISCRVFGENRHPILRFRIDPGKIPDEGRTLTVTTSLLRGGEHDRSLVRNLERFYLRNRDDNAFFGLLCDLPPSDQETIETDVPMLDAAKMQIDVLNRRYGEHFCLFVRRRVYSQGESCYMGWERKRGAILMLTRLLRGIGEQDFLCAAMPDRCRRGIRYVCTLDEDTVLPPDALCVMIGAMLHPYNKPRMENGAVRRGCAILQPDMAVTLEGAAASYFTLLCTGRGGTDPYSRSRMDADAHLYGQGSFCGKGLFDVDAFLEVLDGAFPDHAILSHDFLEGTRLGCANFPAVTFSDSQPTKPASYFSRQSRWVRGDVQAVRFAFCSHKNAHGNTVKNPITMTARLRIIDHLLYALTPPAILRAACLIAFLPLTEISTTVLWVLLFSPYWIRPLGLCLRPWSWHTLRRQLFGAVYTDLRQALYFLGFRITFAAQEGWVNTKAIVTALYRMLISKRKLLEWVTAGEREKQLGKETRAAVVRSMRVSVFLGILFLIFSAHASAKLIGLLWICAPWIASAIAKPVKTRYTHRFSVDFAKKKPDGVLTADEYCEYARAIWNFFSDHVNESTSDLPPDNVQWFPITEQKIARRTSPTNIGLYLCSCVCACEFGLIDPKELFERLERACQTLERMPRCRGHFYNWYDLPSCDVIGVPYISTVDSGNLACALLCAAAGARAYAKSNVGLWRTAKKLQRLAEEMDFSFLYHKASGQLHLGYHTEREELSEGRYDLYASEVRSAVYFAIAMGQIPAAAWDRLQSPITESERMLGILSWTGSAFEYFMPSLWLPTPENGHDAQMLSYAFEQQLRDRLILDGASENAVIFGKSEGAYFGFDAAQNFLYQPYGTAALALCESDQRLCMPYALYLMLPFAPKTVKAALDVLQMLGMKGKYGLYEALDATEKRVGEGYAVVRSYMAHHMGMSLMALTNAAFDGVFQRYFMADERMEAYRVLLCRRLDADAKAAWTVKRESSAAEMRLPTQENGKIAESLSVKHTEQRCVVLSNTASYLIADASGKMTLYHKNIVLTPKVWDAQSLTPMFFCYDAFAHRVYTPFERMAHTEHDVQYRFCEESDRLIWIADYADGTQCTLTARISSFGVGFRFETALFRHGQPLAHVLTVAFRPILFEPYAHETHAAFADLFLQSCRDRRENKIYVRRRPRADGELPQQLTVTAGGLDHFCAASDASHLLPLGYTEDDCRTLGFGGGFPARLGTQPTTSVTPLLCLRGRVSLGSSVVSLQLGDDMPTFDAALISRVRMEICRLCGGDAALVHVGRMLNAAALGQKTRLMHSNGRQRPIHAPRGKERLWKYGVSGDRVIFGVVLGEDAADMGLASEVLSSWKYLLLCGIRCDLIVCVSDTDAYGAPVDRRLSAEIERQGLSYFIGAAGGGIHLCRLNDAVTDGVLLSASLVFSHKAGADTVVPLHPQVMKVNPSEGTTRYALDAHRIIVSKGEQKMPWSYVLSNGVFGTLLTTNTLGFTFFGNSRECRVTPWYGDAASERCGEFLMLRFSGQRAYYDLCRSSQSCVIARDAVHYLGLLPGLSYRVSVLIPDRMKHKRMEIRLKNEATEPITVRLRYQLQPLLGVLPQDGETVSWWSSNGALCFCSETNEACAAYTAVMSLVGCSDTVIGQTGEDMLYVGGEICIPPGEEILAAAHLRVDRDGQRSVISDALIPVRAWRTPVIHSGDAGLDALAATWLPWQILHVRMLARCGYYQPGGAYGFRDQLQDAMAAAEFAPELLYAQLFRAAAHQYREGDVQHWWHPGSVSDRAKFHRGIRSRCSDDRLWLVLAVARYVALTKNTACLHKAVRYLESPPLEEHETERYEIPLRSDDKESLYMHCVRAVEFTLNVGFGVHGLPYIGIGDWNDGMNRVGIRGQGETVWGGMFLMLVLSEFLPLCAEMGDERGIRKYASVIRQLATAIESEAWNGQWYRRAWYDDGTPMGEPGDREAEIDLLPQAFAALINARVRLPGGGKPFDEERVHRAMNAAYERLYDKERGIFALLDPPFGTVMDASVPNPGYIAGYPPGARENGGQYTHAAVWGAMALFAVGEEEHGMRVVRALSPLYQTKSDADLQRYQKEPWGLCGDVLRSRGREGEGGWSLYTGSAGWYYRLLLALFGTEHGEQAVEITNDAEE